MATCRTRQDGHLEALLIFQQGGIESNTKRAMGKLREINMTMERLGKKGGCQLGARTI